MKKRTIILLLIVLLSIFIAPNVLAKDDEKTQGKKCYYRFYSEQYGYSYMVMILNSTGKPAAFITTFNSEPIDGSGRGNEEAAQGWNADLYKQHKEVCPY